MTETQPGPVSPREAYRQSIVEEIGRTARELLEAGQEPTRFRIASAMHMSRRNLFRYVPEISALHAELAREIVDQAVVAADRAVEGLYETATQPTAFDQVAAAWRVLYAIAVDEPARFRLVLEHPEATEALLAIVGYRLSDWASFEVAAASAPRGGGAHLRVVSSDG